MKRKIDRRMKYFIVKERKIKLRTKGEKERERGIQRRLVWVSSCVDILILSTYERENEWKGKKKNSKEREKERGEMFQVSSTWTWRMFTLR